MLRVEKKNMDKKKIRDWFLQKYQLFYCNFKDFASPTRLLSAFSVALNCVPVSVLGRRRSQVCLWRPWQKWSCTSMGTEIAGTRVYTDKTAKRQKGKKVIEGLWGERENEQKRERASEWVSEWLSEWVSEWERERERERQTDRVRDKDRLKNYKNSFKKMKRQKTFSLFSPVNQQWSCPQLTTFSQSPV